MVLAWKCIEYINSVFGDTNLWNNLGFSLYAVLSVDYMIATSDKSLFLLIIRLVNYSITTSLVYK